VQLDSPFSCKVSRSAFGILVSLYTPDIQGADTSLPPAMRGTIAVGEDARQQPDDCHSDIAVLSRGRGAQRRLLVIEHPGRDGLSAIELDPHLD